MYVPLIQLRKCISASLMVKKIAMKGNSLVGKMSWLDHYGARIKATRLLWVFFAFASVLPADPPAGGARPLTGSDLATFMDSFVPAQLAGMKAAGAVVSVVKDGEVLLCRGYGYADVEKRIPMTAETLVRPASISKLFTAIAALQLVKQEKLSLDRDVNDDLDFRIPTPAGGTPVTLRLLLTHRAGFEDHLKELFQAGGPPVSASVWVRRNLPRRLFPGGDVPAYSNYGYGLIGYLVERASGRRFEDYAASFILGPLGMQRSTFEEPPPHPLMKSVARGYPRSGGPPLPYFEVMQPAVGGLSASAADMARFMIALLEPNALTEPTLLPLAFEEDYAANNRFVGKHGLTNAVVSHLTLLPEARFGLFVSYNTLIPMNGQTELLEALAHRYFERRFSSPAQLPSAARDARAVAGAYQPSQRADSNFLRLRALGEELVIEPTPDYRIRLAGTGLILTETAPLVFEGPNDVKMAFHPTANRGLTMSFNAVPIAMEWQRVPLFLDRRFVLSLVFASLFAPLLLCPVAVVVRWRRPHFTRLERDHRDLLRVRVVIASDLLAVTGMGLIAAITTRDLTKLNSSLDPWLTLVYGLAWLGVGGAPMVVWIACRFWRDGVGTQWLRIHQTALAVSAAVFAWFAVTWRIAGTTLNY